MLIKRNIYRKKFSNLKENLNCHLIIALNYRRSVIKIIICWIKQKKERKAKKYRMILLLKNKLKAKTCNLFQYNLMIKMMMKKKKKKLKKNQKTSIKFYRNKKILPQLLVLKIIRNIKNLKTKKT